MKYDHKKVENKVRAFWNKNKIPDKVVAVDKDMKKKFYLLDGPPYVNGVPHVGHIKTTAFKDIWGKFKFMQGYDVWFQPGFDCGGLPIENKVEEKLNIEKKGDIENKIGVKKFIKECDKFAKGNETIWLDLYKKIGAWRGWLAPYLTSENYYLESGWWTVKKIYEKGLLVEGRKPGYWCPHCETVLSGYEISDSYKQVKDSSIYIKFPIKGRKNEYFIVWTTTPWTLNANVVICVHPDEIYVKAKKGEETYIIAEKRLSVLDDLDMDYKVLDKIKGKELEGIKYEPPLDVPLQKELTGDNVHQVVVSIKLVKKKSAGKVSAKKKTEEKNQVGHMVTMDTGSGLVHVAPGHGDVDNKLGKHYHLPEPSPVDEQGKLTEKAGKFAGIFVKDADKSIIDYLREKSRLLHKETITHSYPVCWRCKTPLIYRMSKQWFLALDTLRDKILKKAKQVEWLPSFAKTRFLNLVKDSPDWAITRQRYWGIPLPIWKCEKCDSKKVIGSRKELRKESIEEVDENIDLHKHLVDNIHLKCDCGGKMVREKDIMDVWFDSGIAPWASLGYPYKNKEMFEALKPVDLIDESQDQIRGWFYSLMVCSIAAIDKTAYKKVCLNGWTLDKKGKKMSKSVGNVIFATDSYKELGADLLRLYTCYDIAPWETQKFSLKGAKELRRHLTILWNSYNYFKIYNKVSYDKYPLKIEDKWILSKLHSLIKKTTQNLEDFRFHETGRDIADFITNHFSRTYIKLIRTRDDKATDYVMTSIFNKLTRLIAPVMPFISEAIYTDLFGDSVHLADWPKHDHNRISKDLEEDMEKAMKVTELSNTIRQENGLKLRWPLTKLKTDVQFKNKKVLSVIKKMVNIKDIIINKQVKESGSKWHKKECELGTVYVETKIIEKEALLRELMRRIQQERKNRDLVKEDRITLYLNNKDMKEFENRIKQRVGAQEIKYAGEIEGPIQVTMKEKNMSFNFEKK